MSTISAGAPSKKRKCNNGKGGCSPCCCFAANNTDMEDKENEPPSNASAGDIETDVPFRSVLPNDFGTGTAVSIKLFIHPNCLRFSIDLLCTKKQQQQQPPDIAFHFNPRLEQKYVVRNCRLNGRWGNEETTTSREFDMERNKAYHVTILFAEGQFLVSVNGNHFCGYTYRVPLSQLTEIEVRGMVDVNEVNYKQLVTYPEEEEGSVLPVPIGNLESIAPAEIPVPFTGKLPPQGFIPGSQLEIYGRVKILPHSFYINLQEGHHVWPHPTIPLHLNPRFSTAMGENTFVRNAWLNGSWGQEERCPGFHFNPGSPFLVTIRRGTNSFSVWVNHQLTGEFGYRGDVDNIDSVYIQGDIILQGVLLSDRETNVCSTPACRVAYCRHQCKTDGE